MMDGRFPWRVEGCGGVHMDGTRDGYMVVDANGNRIPRGPYLTLKQAQLWAAAPDLLEKCGYALVLLEQVHGKTVIQGDATVLDFTEEMRVFRETLALAGWPA